jgi:hypothetical protein
LNGGAEDQAAAQAFRPKERILDRMARIVVNQKPNEPYIFSYHYEYKDYLEYYGFIDVSAEPPSFLLMRVCVA